MQAEYQLTLPAIDPKQAEPLAMARMEEALNKLGFIPNMYGVMANSPGLLDTYIHGYERFRELSGFTPRRTGSGAARGHRIRRRSHLLRVRGGV